MRTLTKRVLAALAGIAALLFFVLLSTVWSHLSEGQPTIPRLEGRWWAGYYDTRLLGRQWCVARFEKKTAYGPPDIFDVTRSSTGENFVHLTLRQPNSDLRVEAKQLYHGKRYYLGRLMVGRFRDFWKMNTDVAIRGEIASHSTPNEFAIEPIADDRLSSFWTRFVRPEEGEPTPMELLHSVDVEVHP